MWNLQYKNQGVRLSEVEATLDEMVSSVLDFARADSPYG